jgi:chromate transporter
MLTPLAQKRDWVGLLTMLAVFTAIGLLRWPLPMVLLVAVPLSTATVVVIRRKAAA